jgi:membrane protease YdiL (CAAX protease family)
VVRGYIYRALKERWRWWVSALMSSLLFSLLHIFNPDVSWVALINIVLAGVILALLVERSGSLWSAVLAHGVWNFAVACLLSLPVSGISMFRLLDLSIEGEGLLTGGKFGPEGSLLLTLLAVLLIAVLWPRREGAMNRAPTGSVGA